MTVQLGLMLVLTTRLFASLDIQIMDEYRVKAAFLYNFAKFVEWPIEVLRDPGQRFTICVLGKDPFGSALEEVIVGKAIMERPLRIRRLSDLRQIDGCQILFVSSSSTDRTLLGLAAAKQPGMLTVGEAGNPGTDGLVIKFALEGSKVRFEINVAAAEEERLRLSSKLLSLATVVRR